MPTNDLLRSPHFLAIAILALAIAICGGLGCDAQEDYEMVDVVILANTLQAGEIFTEEMVDTKLTPRQYLPSHAIAVEDMDRFLGEATTRERNRGCMLFATDFIGD